MSLLSPDPVTFGDARFLHPGELRALTWVQGKLLTLADTTLTLWSAEGERLASLDLSDTLSRWGDLRFIPSAAPGQVVLGPKGVSGDADYQRLAVTEDRLERLAQLPAGLDSSVSYYADALDLGEHLLVAHGGAVERRSWATGEVEVLLESPLAESRERGAALSADGRLVAFSGYPEPEVVVLDLATGTELVHLAPTKVHGGFGPILAFHPDGRRLFTAYSQMYRTGVEEWDVGRGERLRELVAHVGSGDVMSIQLVGETLLLRQAGVDVLCWDLSAGQLRWNQTNQALPAKLAAGERWVIAAERRVLPLNPADGAPIGEPGGLSGVARSVAYDPSSGRTIACGGKSALVFDAEGAVVDRVVAQRVHAVPGDQEVLLELRGRAYAHVELVRYRLADGETRPLLSGAYGQVQHAGEALLLIDSYFSRPPKRARVFSPAGKERLALGRSLPDHGAASPDGSRAILANKTRLILHELSGGEVLWDLKKATKGSAELLVFHPDCRRFAAATPKELSVWDGEADEPLLKVKLDGAPRALRWLDEARLIVITEKGTLLLEGLDGAEERQKVAGPVVAASLAEDGTLLVSTEAAGLQRYDLSEWLGLSWTAPVEAEAGAFLDLEVLHDASGEALRDALEAADWARLQPDRDLPALRDLLQALEQREGVTAAHHLAAARLLERDDTQLLHRFGHEEALTAFGLSRDGRWLATGSWTGTDYERGGTLQVWDVRAGRCVNILDPIYGGVGWPDYGRCVQWSPDGSRVGMAYNTNGVGSVLPFEEGAVFELESYVTDGWSRPPAWCWGPDSRSLVVWAWGGSPIPGCVISAGKPTAHEDDATWFAPALPEGVEVELQPPVGGLWSPDGARIQGHNRHGHAYAVDPKTRALLWLIEASTPAAWSPDGQRFAHCGGGALSLHDATTGARTGQLAVGGVSGLSWSPDSRTLAAVLGDGVQLARDGKLLAHLPGRPKKEKWDFPDGQTWAFSPDGGLGAFLEDGGRLTLWRLPAEGKPERLAQTRAPEAANGVLLGDGALITYGKGILEFRDLDGLGVFATYTPGEPRGDLLEAPSPLRKGKVNAGGRFDPDPAFPMRGPAGFEWALAFPTGLVVASEALQPRLDEELSLVVARQHALPFRWLEAPVFADLGAAGAHPALPLSEKERQALAPKPKKAPAPRKGAELPLETGPLTLLTDAWWASVKELHSGWNSHVSEHLCGQIQQLIQGGHLDHAAKAVPRIPEAWWRAVAFAKGARLLAERGQTEVAEGWLSQGLALEPKVLTEWNATFVCAPLAVACHALGREAEAQGLLTKASPNLSGEANAFQRYGALADAQHRCGQPEAARATLDSGPWNPGWVPHMLKPYVIARLREDVDAGIRFVDYIIQKAGKCDEFDISDAGVAALIAAGRAAEVPGFVRRFGRLSTDHYVVQALDALRARGQAAEARAMLDRAIRDSAEWPASQVEWAPRLLEMDRAAGEDLTLELLSKGEALATSYYPGRALGHLCHALALMGQVDAVLQFADQLPGAQRQLEVLCGGLRGAPGEDRLIDAALARIASLGADARTRAKAIAQVAAASQGPRSEALWGEAIEVGKQTTRDDRRWVTDDLVGIAVRAEHWQAAWRALFIVPKSKRQYNMSPLVDAMAARGMARAVIQLAEQQDTKDLNDRPNTLSRAIERFPRGA